MSLDKEEKLQCQQDSNPRLFGHNVSILSTAEAQLRQELLAHSEHFVAALNSGWKIQLTSNLKQFS